MEGPKRIYIDDWMMQNNGHLLAKGSPAIDTEYIRADLVNRLIEYAKDAANICEGIGHRTVAECVKREIAALKAVEG